MKFTETKLEQAFIELLENQKMKYFHGKDIRSTEKGNIQEPKVSYGHFVSEEVLIKEDIKDFLLKKYKAEGITEDEITQIITDLERLPESDLYESNKIFMKWLSDGFVLQREDRSKKNIFIQLIDYSSSNNNHYKVVNQLAIGEFKKVNRAPGIDFSKKMEDLVEKYNEQDESDVLRSEVLENFSEEIIYLFHELIKEKDSFVDMGIDFEEKAFYDILKSLAKKYDFTYPEDKLIHLAKKIKTVVDDKAKHTDLDHREDIKTELKVDLIISC